MRKPWLRSSLKRGRPARYKNMTDIRSLEYLIYLSDNHDIDPIKLLNSFSKIGEKNTVTCGPLKIVLRERTSNHAIFLLTRKEKIVAQIRMNNTVWENPTKVRSIYSYILDRSPHYKKPMKRPSSIKELRNGMKNVDLRVKVSEKSEIKKIFSRYTGKPILLCVATVRDSSGSIRLPLWNNKIDAISIGDEIEIRNGSVNTFQGLLQITPTRKSGKLVIVNT